MEPQDGKRSMVKWVMNLPNWSALGIFRDFDRVYGGGRQCVASSNLVTFHSFKRVFHVFSHCRL
ncbi:hypothetical protein Hanom_Chr11g01015561 [Helianthus anomalus]